MKQIKRVIEKGGNGFVFSFFFDFLSFSFVILRPEEAEDMWHIYNLIRVDDIVKSSTIRKVFLDFS